MNIGVHLRCFRSAFNNGMTLPEALDLCAEWGAQKVVIPWASPGKTPPGLDSKEPTYLAEICAAVRARGMDVAAFWICNDFAFDGDGDWRQQQIDATQLLLRFSAEQGIADLQIWTGRYNKNADEAQRRKQEQLVRDALAACVPIAEQSGVRLSVENHTDVFPRATDLVNLCTTFGPSLTLCPNPALWGIQSNKDGFFSGDDATHAFIRDELLITAAHMSLVNLGIWSGTGPFPEPWGNHWDALQTILQEQPGESHSCCLQTYADDDLIDPLPLAISRMPS